MRFWLFFLFFLVTSLGLIKTYSLTPLGFNLLPTVLSERNITLRGNHLLSQEDLINDFSPKLSNIFWFLMSERVEKVIAQHPLIQNAQLDSCTYWDFSCYKISITEEKPSYLYQVNNHWWALNEAGDFLWPISEANTEKFFPTLPKLKDLLFQDRSAEFLQVRIRFLINLQKLLTKEGISPQNLYLLENNDLKIEISDYSGEIFLSNYDLAPQKFEIDLQNLKTFLSTSTKGEIAEQGTLDLRPKHPVLKNATVSS